MRRLNIFLYLFTKKVAPFEFRLILIALAFATLLAVVYSSEILRIYPVCTEDEPCPYLVPVFTGSELPEITWNSYLREFSAYATFFEVEMQTLFEAGLGGTLVDPMMASGFLVSILTLWFSLSLDTRFHNMIHQIDHDQLIPNILKTGARIERKRRRWSWFVLFLVAAVMFIGILGYFDGYLTGLDDLAFLFGSTLLGAIAGHRLGSIVAYGRFSRQIRDSLDNIRLLPGHADKMGGWQRLAEFFAFEAVILLIPAIWLSTWLYIELQHTDKFLACARAGGDLPWPVWLTQECDSFPFGRLYNQYIGWMLPQVALLVIVLAILYKAFLKPLYRTTRAYRKARADIRSRYDAMLAAPFRAAVDQLTNAGSLDQERMAIDEIGKLSALREEIWTLPAIPLRSVLTGIFSVSALYPLITLFLTLVLPAGEGVGDFMDIVLKLFGVAGL